MENLGQCANARSLRVRDPPPPSTSARPYSSAYGAFFLPRKFCGKSCRWPRLNWRHRGDGEGELPERSDDDDDDDDAVPLRPDEVIVFGIRQLIMV